MNVNEIWKQIKGYEGIYDISNYGRIYSYPRNTSKGGYTFGKSSENRYLQFTFYKNGIGSTKKIHKIVYETFVGPIPKGFDVHHKNHNKKDNRVENLCLIEESEHKSMHLAERNLKKSKPIQQFNKDGELLFEYSSISEASRILGINRSNISACCLGKRNIAGGFVWKYKEVA